jgi:hypothetical protein
MSVVSPHEIVSSRRWDHVLFTTYSLSLSFFEAHLLRTGLKKNGCGDIWVVVDADGYSDSLAEKQATSVGQDYHLVPVALPSGVFHPKCVYLSGPDGDVLVVGSGNLTFGGYGRNLEVFEAFASKEYPAIFSQFAEFLAALKVRTDLLNPEPEWIEKFRLLAYRAGASSTLSNLSAPRLVHCVTSPVIEELVKTISASGGASAMRVLSPFFDPNAKAITRLADESGASKVIVGLLPGQTDSSAFPFSNHTLGKKLYAATIQHADQLLDRRLHAKWIEADLLDGGRLTMTGSVNATSQSLCSTNNIELGVLRVETAPAESRLTWMPTTVPKAWEKQFFRASGLGSRCVLHARLSDHGSIDGRILSSGDPSGRWEALLARKDGVSATFEIEIGVDGKFEHRLAGLDAFEHAAGLQLELHRSQPTALSACGWVQNEAILALTQLSQVPVRTLLNQIRGEATDEDDVLVLELLATGLQDLRIRPQSKPAAEANGTPTPATPPAVVSVATLAPGEALPSGFVVPRATPASDRLAGILDRVVSRVFSAPVAAGGLRTIPHGEDEEDEEAPEESDDEPTIPPKAITLLERIREKVRELADGEHRRILLNLWLGISIQLFLRAKRRAEAAEFCRDWLFTAASCSSHEAPSGLLSQHVLHVASVLGANTVGSNDAARELVRLHDALENFFGALSPATAAGGLSPMPPLLRNVLSTEDADPVKGLQSILAARTRRQEIGIILHAVASRTPLPTEELAVFAFTTGGQLLKDLKSRVPPRLVEVPVGRSACPKCYLRLSDESLRELQRLRLCRCVNCSNYLYQLAISQ